MLYLYQGSGASDFEILEFRYSDKQWEENRSNVLRLLKARKQLAAADLLEKLPFQVYEATNYFNDEFCVLVAHVPIHKYVELEERFPPYKVYYTAKPISEAMDTLFGVYIRFVAVQIDNDDNPALVESPTLEITSSVVEQALQDAVQLIRTNNAVSGVDRVHTALHGYLKEVCKKENIPFGNDESITKLFKLLKNHHPAFTVRPTRFKDIERIVQSVSTMLDAMNTLRNRASIAHPNDTVLEEPEAMLFINSSRTLLHYFDARFSGD